MALERWNPLRDIEGMRKDMDRIWEEIFPFRRGGASWKKPAEKSSVAPAIDIIDKENEIVVRAEMPGVGKDGIDVSMQDNVLTVRGEIKEDKEDNEFKEENFYYSERETRQYLRSIEMPFKINPDKIKATLKDGLLIIRLPKAGEIQPRKITIEVA